MSKIALVIANPDSPQLPDKHNRMIGNHTVMEWIINSLYKVVDSVAICTTKEGLPYYNRYINTRVNVVAPDIDETDVMGRIKKAAEILKGNYYLIVSGDFPLISVSYMRDCLEQLMINHNFDGCTIGDTVEAITHKGVNKLEYGEYITLNKVSNLNIFSILTLNDIRCNFRCKLENFADLAFLRECYARCEFTLEGVSSYVNANSDIKKINEHVDSGVLDLATPNVAFITEGNDEIGIGHLARCISLAQYYNECCGKHIHFYVNNNPLVIELLNRYGYEINLDFSYGFPVIDSSKFSQWKFIIDTYSMTSIDYDLEYRKNPCYAVNYRLNYVNESESSYCIISFGKGKFSKYGLKIWEDLQCVDSYYLHNSKDIAKQIKGAERIITVWSQTARECIFMGKVPEVYSTNYKDDLLCEFLHNKGVLIWQGNLFQKIQI